MADVCLKNSAKLLNFFNNRVITSLDIRKTKLKVNKLAPMLSKLDGSQHCKGILL